ncbi:MAG: hypothetical protein ACRDM1_16215, partial [Gaiellaceae bacterium]
FRMVRAADRRQAGLIEMETRHESDLTPQPLRALAALSWRLLVVAGAVLALAFLLARLRLVILPLVAALLLATLLAPLCSRAALARLAAWGRGVSSSATSTGASAGAWSGSETGSRPARSGCPSRSSTGGSIAPSTGLRANGGDLVRERNRDRRDHAAEDGESAQRRRVSSRQLSAASARRGCGVRSDS